MSPVDINKSVVYKDEICDFISMGIQWELIDSIRPDSILEVGIGNGKLSQYLRSQEYHVTTCDFDERTHPDKIGNILCLPFPDASFELVSAFEILEHLPFKDVWKALQELYRVSRRFVVISIPYQTFNLGGMLWVYKHHKPLFIRLCERSWETYPVLENGIHYWEMGFKGYSRERIRDLVQSVGFVIVREVSDCRFPGHYFFVLAKEES